MQRYNHFPNYQNIFSSFTQKKLQLHEKQRQQSQKKFHHTHQTHPQNTLKGRFSSKFRHTKGQKRHKTGKI